MNLINPKLFRFLPLLNRKYKVIQTLNRTYCRIAPSPISGVGVFAIRNIPKGINPFIGERPHRWTRIKKSELKNKVDMNIMNMINDFFVEDENGNIDVMVGGFNNITISYFINHSRAPNLTTKDGNVFITLRDIEKGEELTVDYKTYTLEKY